MMNTITGNSCVKRLTALAASLGLLAALTACSMPWSASGSEDGNPSGERIASSMNALFDQYLAKKTLSPFEREVLHRAKGTGKISAEDYETAHSKQMACEKEHGFAERTHKLSNGLYQYLGAEPMPSSQAEVDKYMQISDQCSQGVSKIIESLYAIQQGNPDLLADSNEAAVACLKKSGLVSKEWTGKRLANALQGDDIKRNLPFDTSSDAAQACFAGAGLAVAIS
ncbi:MAG: hypothetical protein LKF49_07510 [Bifidobacterium tibiigranuli]|jgi:hypothetical protein|uniref:hypothetical protein n=1 Tax=Bifidobacterium tibiigranuli TaxID=2172043 RepID=UPI002352AE1A|nr:hypothetical protein [Bifidobacterium tibiigranuli]MCH3974050.1 hypothetical protein [Bifidobacterium tibiigranuli]MCH4189080.1 hypothetical protein [Bifidobacterium tibiigranuli]MCH4204040.1 hypothetical protein [Bifidobacterium tibiigranuli]MCH4274453.1 hypothetical protein [Bifidobacterium tibiigranuli]MCI1790782.1 hypothetical protein [Bifidobacterium tibiigranuli]